MQKYTEKYLRTNISNEKILDRTYYYSLAQKEQKNLKFLKNQRLFLLDFDQGRIYYANQTKNLPFKTSFPQPKTEYATINQATINHLPNTNELELVFPFNKEQINWKFVFETNELAEQWIKLIEYQKVSQQVKEKDMKSLNKAIFELPILQKQQAKDIVKQPQRDIANDQSKLLESMMGISRMKPNEKYQPYRADKNQSKNYIDWNHRFYNERTIFTLYQFQEAALDSFYKTLQKDQNFQEQQRIYENESFVIKIANRYTLTAKKLKIQYRNYHFIVDATNKKFIVGVPLTCLVEFQDVVALVKAKFPEKVDSYVYDGTIKDQLTLLQRYTRIKNRVLQFGTILDLGKHYQPQSRQLLLYLQNLHDYLPLNLQFPNEQTLIRPEYLLDKIDRLIFSGPPDKIGKSETRQLRQLGLLASDQAKQFSNKFFLEQFPIVKMSELKNLFHDSGLNLKYLPYVYGFCSNPIIKKYIYSAMTAKVVKDYIFQNVVKIKVQDSKYESTKLVEETLIILLEGNNNRSYQIWKEISLIFKKKFNIVLNHKEILPGFFLNSILELIPGRYDISKINKKKKLFEEMKIIDTGFLRQLLPKVKVYDRFMPEQLENLKIQAKQYVKSNEISKKILAELFNPKTKSYQTFYQFGKNDQWMIEYLSLFYPPENLANADQDRIKLLYDRINTQPPSSFTMNLTKSYLEWCNKKENTQEFKIVFERAMAIADYWLDENHPMRSDLLEILSDYFSILGVNDDMIKYMRDSLVICSKFWGAGSKQSGLKQYELADRYLRAGKKKEAIQNFYKAKENMEQNKSKSNKHGLALMKLASICLSDLQYEKAIQFAQNSIKSFQEYEKRINSQGIYNEPFKIKAFEILARVYQICDRRSQYKDLALVCARKFNLTKNKEVFQQMIRISLASSIFKSNNDRCDSFINLTRSLLKEGKQNPAVNSAYPSIDELMKMADDMNVMQRFIYKFQYFQRSLFELNQKKRQLTDDSREFVQILRHVIDVVGFQYIKGLVDQKISCST